MSSEGAWLTHRGHKTSWISHCQSPIGFSKSRAWNLSTGAARVSSLLLLSLQEHIEAHQHYRQPAAARRLPERVAPDLAGRHQEEAGGMAGRRADEGRGRARSGTKNGAAGGSGGGSQHNNTARWRPSERVPSARLQLILVLLWVRCRVLSFLSIVSWNTNHSLRLRRCECHCVTVPIACLMFMTLIYTQATVWSKFFNSYTIEQWTSLRGSRPTRWSQCPGWRPTRICFLLKISI